MNADDFPDPQTLAVEPRNLEQMAAEPSKRPPRHRQGQDFIKGPLPWDWWQQALLLPGVAVHVSLLLWKLAGCSQTRIVRFCQAAAARTIRVHLTTVRTALRTLEHAGLISIRRLPGRSLEVIILDAPNAVDR
jgi:hypothetical protein